MKVKKFHILAYFIQPENEELERYLLFFREERLKTRCKNCKQIESIGKHLTIEDVLDFAKNSAVGRPHIAQAMLAKGLVS